MRIRHKLKRWFSGIFRGYTPPHFAFVSYASRRQKEAGLPVRKTRDAAGYDFTAPEDMTIGPGEVAFFDTGIKAHMPRCAVLLLFPRSSTGIRRRIILANGTGIIDADYADNAENEGNIGAALWNCGNEPQTIRAGECYMQGVFVNYMTTAGDTGGDLRSGGIGSTGK